MLQFRESNVNALVASLLAFLTLSAFSPQNRWDNGILNKAFSSDSSGDRITVARQPVIYTRFLINSPDISGETSNGYDCLWCKERTVGNIANPVESIGNAWVPALNYRMVLIAGCRHKRSAALRDGLRIWDRADRFLFSRYRALSRIEKSSASWKNNRRTTKRCILKVLSTLSDATRPNTKLP